MSLRSFAVAACFSLLAGTAFAADLTIPVEDVPVIDNTFNWEGAYVGVQGGVEYFDSEYIYAAADVFVGYNFLVSENILLGVEASFGAIADEYDTYGQIFVLGRAGVLVTPDVLLYGVAGAGYEWYWGDPDYYDDTLYQIGAGVEFAVADNITLRGQITGVGYFDDSDLFESARATVGVAFHF